MAGQDVTDSGHGQDDPIGVGFGVEVTDAVVEEGDLLGDLERDRRLGGDVGGEGLEVEAVLTHRAMVASAAATTAAGRSGPQALRVWCWNQRPKRARPSRLTW